MTDVLEELKSGFNRHISFREKRPGVTQICAPIYHEDGDMLDIFLDTAKSLDGRVRFSDYGLTLMRLSYIYDLDSPTKRRIFQKIITENGIAEEKGILFMDAPVDQIHPYFMQFAQTIAKVSNLQVLKREIVQNLFYELLNEFIGSHLSSYSPQADFVPIQTRPDIDVDWRFSKLNQRDIYLYGVKDTAKARLAVLSCLEFQKASIPFRSVIVHEDFEAALSEKDKRRLTNTADKQFTSLSDFKEGAEEYFAREYEVA